VKKVFLIIVCLLMILTACSVDLVKPDDVPKPTEQVIVTATPTPTPLVTPEPTPVETPEPTPLPADYVLGEDLRESQGEVYRCEYQICLYDYLIRPIIRVELMPDGTGVLRLVTEAWDLSDDDGKFVIIEDLQRNLSKGQIDSLLRLIQEGDFWTIGEYQGIYNPTRPPTWLYVDGIKDGEFHDVYRHFAPLEAVADIYDLFMYFIELCGETEYDLW